MVREPSIFSKLQIFESIHEGFFFSVTLKADITMPYHHFFKKTDNILFKKLMVKCGNPLENWHLCTILLKICFMTFSNTSGNMLRIIINKNGAKVLWKCGNMYGNGYSNLWESVVTRSIKVREIPKAQMILLNESKCSFLHSDCLEH